MDTNKSVLMGISKECNGALGRESPGYLDKAEMREVWPHERRWRCGCRGH